MFLPGAPHFVITRDGRDVAVSLTLLELANGGGVFNEFKSCAQLVKIRRAFLADGDFFKKNPDQLLTSEVFVRAVCRRWAEQVRHDMQTVAKIRVGEIDATAHTVTYEALHADPEGERNKMYSFLGLDPSEAAPLTADSETTPGLRGDNHKSDRRKGAVGDWRTYFTDQSRRWFKEEAGEALVQMGYELNSNW
ncbi:MAG: sulfotransferase domain-containing protein [Phycisphaerales bacterium]|nr:sulfotransferase domain-containing protein [Phycisphaerales bacterium]